MTVRELIETNMLLCDVTITLRDREGILINELNIGPDYGVKPPYPQQVPISEEYKGDFLQRFKKDAVYIRKNINTYDDGKGYFHVKSTVFPKGWLDLEVQSWHSGHVYAGHHQMQRPVDDWMGIRIEACRYEDTLTVLEEPKAIENKQEQLEGQMNIFDFVENEVKE